MPEATSRAQDVALSAFMHASFSNAPDSAAIADGAGGATWPLRALSIAPWFDGPDVAVAKTCGFALVVTRSRTTVALAAVRSTLALQIRGPGDSRHDDTIGAPWTAELVLAPLASLLFTNRLRLAVARTALSATVAAFAVLATPAAAVLVPLFARARRGRRLLAAVSANSTSAFDPRAYPVRFDGAAGGASLPLYRASVRRDPDLSAPGPARSADYAVSYCRFTGPRTGTTFSAL